MEMALWIYTYFQTHQVVYIKYVYFQSYFLMCLKKKRQKTNRHFTKENIQMEGKAHENLYNIVSYQGNAN